MIDDTEWMCLAQTETNEVRISGPHEVSSSTNTPYLQPNTFKCNILALSRTNRTQGFIVESGTPSGRPIGQRSVEVQSVMAISGCIEMSI